MITYRPKRDTKIAFMRVNPWSRSLPSDVSLHFHGLLRATERRCSSLFWSYMSCAIYLHLITLPAMRIWRFHLFRGQGSGHVVNKSEQTARRCLLHLTMYCRIRSLSRCSRRVGGPRAVAVTPRAVARPKVPFLIKAHDADPSLSTDFPSPTSLVRIFVCLRCPNITAYA